MTVWTTIERGEYVMFALAVILIVIVLIWWIRGASLVKERKDNPTLLQRVRDHVVDGDLENARQICSASSTPGGRVLESGIKRIGHPITDVEMALNDHREIEVERFRRGVGWLKTFAIICPLLGFGGTLVGLIDRLRDLGEQGALVDISMVCAQVAPTIVTTVAGLIVGIFSLVALTFLESTVNVSRRRLEELCAQFTDLLNEPS